MRGVGEAERSEAGTTLVELLVTIVILGIAFTTLLGGTFTAVATADRQRKQSVAEATLRSFAEAVKGSTTFDASCSTGPYEDLSVYTPPANFSHRVVSCQWLPADGGAPSTTKPAGPLAQLLKLEVASDDGRATEAVDMVKRQ